MSTIQESLAKIRANKYFFKLCLFFVVGIWGFVRVSINLIALDTDYIYYKDIIQEYVLIKAVQAGEYPYSPLPDLIAEFVATDEILQKGTEIPVLNHPTPHPPTLILFFSPFLFMSYEQAARVWFIIEIGLLLSISLLTVRHAIGKITPYVAFIIFASLLGWNAVFQELIYGQLQLLILFMLMIALMLLRKDHQVWGGIVLGVALSVKVFVWPLLFLLFVKRFWKAVFSCLGIFLMLNVITGIIVGFDVIRDYYFFIGPSVTQYYQAFGYNYSLSTIGWRLFDGTGSTILLEFSAPPLLESFFLARLVSLLVPLFFLTVCVTYAYREQNLDVTFSLFVVVAILISPISWIHYFSLTLIPLSVIVRTLKCHNYPTNITIFTGFAIIFLVFISETRIITSIVNGFSTGVINSERQVSFWAGLFSYLPLLALLAVTGILLITNREKPLSFSK
jgi:hypothetical protein